MVISFKDAGTYPLVIAKIMLSYLCLSPLQTGIKWRTLSFILFINVFCMLAAHMTYMFQNITDMALMGSTCTTVSASIQTTTKILLLNYYKKDLAEILQTISKDFWPADIMGPAVETSILKGSRVIVAMVSVYLSSAFLSAWDYVAIHLVFGRRILPLESTFPFAWDVSPTFEFITIWQFVLHMYVIIHTIATHDFFFNALVSSCLAQFKIMKAVLSSVGTGKDLMINQQLSEIFPDKYCRKKGSHFADISKQQYDLVAKCIEHHNKVIDICKKLQVIYGKMILLQFFLSALALCVSTFVLTQFDNYLTKMLSFAVAHVIQFFFLCAIANELIYQSQEIADASYGSEWYKHPNLKVRRALILIIARAQREVKITAMGFANLDYPSFVNVLRFSFSFYTLLSSLEEK